MLSNRVLHAKPLRTPKDHIDKLCPSVMLIGCSSHTETSFQETLADI